MEEPKILYKNLINCNSLTPIKTHTNHFDKDINPALGEFDKILMNFEEVYHRYFMNPEQLNSERINLHINDKYLELAEVIGSLLHLNEIPASLFIGTN